jgi:surface protein
MEVRFTPLTKDDLLREIKLFIAGTSIYPIINDWDVSHITNMDGLFEQSTFNSNISGWTVSQVTTMESMFFFNPVFDQPIGDWNVSNVTNMSHMFMESKFNQPIGGWNVGRVINMQNMFWDNTAFNQPIGGWNVSNVTYMDRMFMESKFNQPIENWNVGRVKDMSYMFNGNTVFNQPIGGWNVSPVTNTDYMFLGALSMLDANKPRKHRSILQKQSSICTDQGRENTCYAHSVAKIYLQNIYLYVHPIEVTYTERFQTCFDVLKTDIDHDYNSKISLGRCGYGYYKILLFLYLYWLIKAPEDKDVFPDQFNNLISTVTAMDEIPNLFNGQNKIQFEKIRKVITNKIQQRHVMWDCFIIFIHPSTARLLKQILISILNLGFYIEVTLDDTDITSTNQLGHSVIMTTYNGVEFGIVNSYGDIISTTTDISKITLHGTVFEVNMFLFILPFYADTPRLPKYVITEDLEKKFTPQLLPHLVEWTTGYADNIRNHKIAERQLDKANGGTRKCKKSKNKRLMKLTKSNNSKGLVQ